MPRSVTEITVFVACPSDCARVRTAVRSAIDEINNTLGRSQQIQLRYLGWDTDVAPGVADRPQEVINQQIGDTYDIFIGVIANRFGAPTGRYGSGTEEEFRLALNRFKQTSIPPKIMFYRDTSPIDSDLIDPDQLSKVRTFENQIRNEGVLMGKFSDIQNFEQQLRIHLHKQLHGFAGTSPETNLHTTIIAQADPTEETGIFDAILSAQENMENFCSGLGRITGFANDLNASLNNRVETMQSMKLSAPIHPARAKHIIDLCAEDMIAFGVRTNNELPIISRQFRAGMEGATQAITLTRDQLTSESPEELAKLQLQSKELREVIEPIRKPA